MKNPYAEAIECLTSGKSLKPVIIKIAQDNPSVFVKAFRACYPVPDKIAEITALAKHSKIEAMKLYRNTYGETLIESKKAVEELIEKYG